MASVTISLDKRSKLKDGTFPVVLVVSNLQRTARIGTGVYLHPSEWNVQRHEVTGNRSSLNVYLSQRLNDARNALLSIRKTGRHKTATANELRDMILATLEPQETTPITFKSWFDIFTQRHENNRTRELYNSTWNMIEKYEPHADQLTFDKVTKAWLTDFFNWCSSTSPSVNARNIHLRNIRAVFNDAIDNEVTTLYPFRRLKITPVPTPKRSLSTEELRDILTCRVGKTQQRYFDVFRLSFFLIGINLVDLCHLPTTAIQDGRLVYVRRKTHKLYSIRIEREAAEIMKRYVKGGAFLLQFYNGENYRAFGQHLNENLPEGVSLYWARHSWATVAASIDIPDDVISLALGHSAKNPTTDIYIRRDLKKVDEANRKVIDYVLHGER